MTLAGKIVKNKKMCKTKRGEINEIYFIATKKS
jgi:hypothetical protein